MTGLSKDKPYPGLRPFDTGDEDFFFGREAQTRGLDQKLRASRLVAVVGRSGCGKSSLVRAGLLPLLCKESGSTDARSWRIASFRPQGQPIAGLTDELLRLASEMQSAKPPLRDTAAGTEESSRTLDPKRIAQLRRGRLDAMLRRSGRGLVEAAEELDLPEAATLLIVVDQFEEIFRFEGKRDGDADEAIVFVRLLTEAIQAETIDIRVILTMRLDFLGDCARFPRLPEAISDGQFLVPTLSRAERRAAIEEPARKSGVTINPAVTQRLLNEIGEDPDRLPVLQHVLMRTWQQAKGAPQITLEHYKATGEVANAISRHADEVLAGLPTDAHRDIAERMFKAISELDRRGRAIRRPAKLGELAAIADGQRDTVEQVVDAFRAPECCFLMPPASQPLEADTPIDISHESLLRGWRNMTGERPGEGWLAEEDRNGKTYRNLLEAAHDGATLPPKIARERQNWWNKINPNRDWAVRYGGDFDLVRTFLETNSRQEFRRRAVIYGLIGLVAVTMSVLVIKEWEAQERNREQASNALRQKIKDQQREIKDQEQEITLQTMAHQSRENGRQLGEAKAQFEAQRQALIKEFEASRSELVKQLEEIQRTLPAQTSDKVRAELVDSLAATSARPDEAAQRVDPKRPTSVSDASDAPDPLVDKKGYMWIGSKDKGNLRPPDGGTTVPANAVENGKEYLVATGIYLRPEPPDRKTYAQKGSIGELDEGARIQLLKVEDPYPRPHAPQYWAQVKVISLPPPTVYFQFAGGSREQALEVSKKLRDKGYAIPGEQRAPLPAGKPVVRYFNDADKTAAEKLASVAQEVLQELAYPQPVRTERIVKTSKDNPDGNLELWIEIPPR